MCWGELLDVVDDVADVMSIYMGIGRIAEVSIDARGDHLHSTFHLPYICSDVEGPKPPIRLGLAGPSSNASGDRITARDLMNLERPSDP